MFSLLMIEQDFVVFEFSAEGEKCNEQGKSAFGLMEIKSIDHKMTHSQYQHQASRRGSFFFLAIAIVECDGCSGVSHRVVHTGFEFDIAD
jgi:hypothetical protein